ncbi:MAG: hypothetical protein PUB51_06620 [Oscillospiraceae bacterium]|nr:hypothetical protein [Oscillospiraceae bacterium]
MSQIQYFLGANSPTGFYSLYDEISDPHRIGRLYILKGGPGCGKSSLMRRLARHGEAAGRRVHRILCSGDPDSLDGVIFPDLGTAVVDGTAPHVGEANCPGAVETYLDLSRFYDHAALQEEKDRLLELSAAYKDCYRQAYRCIGAAGELRRNLREWADSAELRGKLQKRAAGVIARELKRSPKHPGHTQRRFLSALTHRGMLTLWDTVSAQAERVYELSDSFGTAHHLLSPILAAAEAAGYEAVACPDPMCPDRLAHLILPELSLAFVTSSSEQPWGKRPYRHLRLDAMAEATLKQLSRPRLRFTRKVSDALLADGVSNLAGAKELHDQLEGLYNPHVDFTGVYETADALAGEIFS